MLPKCSIKTKRSSSFSISFDVITWKSFLAIGRFGLWDNEPIREFNRLCAFILAGFILFYFIFFFCSLDFYEEVTRSSGFNFSPSEGCRLFLPIYCWQKEGSKKEKFRHSEVFCLNYSAGSHSFPFTAISNDPFIQF